MQQVQHIEQGLKSLQGLVLVFPMLRTAAYGGVATHFWAAHAPIGRQTSKGSLTAGRPPDSLGKAVLHGHGCMYRVQRVGQAIW